MTQEQFENLSARDQWKWVIENKSSVQHIELDNDETYITLSSDPDHYFRMISDIGNRQGANDLLKALGFEVFDV